MAVVKIALVVAKDDQGKYVYLYQGTEVPASIGKEERERLADFITADEPDDKPAKK